MKKKNQIEKVGTMKRRMSVLLLTDESRKGGLC